MLNRRPMIALIAALCLWAPSLKAFLTEQIDVVPAATRFLAAFGVAWIGVTILGIIVAGYGNAGPAEPPTPRRRRSDHPDGNVPAEVLEPEPEP
jgi:hypothetical protein